MSSLRWYSFWKKNRNRAKQLMSEIHHNWEVVVLENGNSLHIVSFFLMLAALYFYWKKSHLFIFWNVMIIIFSKISLLLQLQFYLFQNNMKTVPKMFEFSLNAFAKLSELRQLLKRYCLKTFTHHFILLSWISHFFLWKSSH